MDFKFFGKVFVAILKAIPHSIYLTVWGFLLGLVIAVLFALVIRKDIKVLKQIIKFLISIIRGTPTILQIYIVYYVVPFLIQTIAGRLGIAFDQTSIPTGVLVIIALGINRAGYLTETIRSGLAAVSKQELEAAHSIGMTPFMTFRFVIFPQTLRICLPNFSTNLINVLHASSLAFYVTFVEMTGTANIMAQDNWKYFESYIAVGLIYWGITIVIELIDHVLELRLTRHERAV